MRRLGTSSRNSNTNPRLKKRGGCVFKDTSPFLWLHPTLPRSQPSRLFLWLLAKIPEPIGCVVQSHLLICELTSARTNIPILSYLLERHILNVNLVHLLRLVLHHRHPVHLLRLVHPNHLIGGSSCPYRHHNSYQTSCHSQVL